jgi:paraquat-inducible protein B
VERLNAIVARVEALPLDSFVSEAAGVATDLRALLQEPGLAELPARLVALADEATLALADARGILATVNDADLAARLANAITAGEEAATAIRDGAERLPAIAERAEAFIAGLGELPLEELVAEITSLATSANALVSSESTQALPGDLSAALAEVQGILAEVREADVVGNLNATLQSARAAAETLPGLVERAGLLLDTAATTLQGFQGAGGVVSEAQAAIREVGRAAEAVASLARTIERNPAALIFGD